MWFTEDAWSPIVMCTLIGGLSLVGALTLQKPKLMLATLVLAIAAVVIYFVEQAIVTDTERIELSLQSLVDTFVSESQANPKPQQAICANYFGARNTRDRHRIAAAVAIVRVEDLRLTDVSIQLTNQGTRAITQFRANGTVRVGAEGGHYPTRWELSWQKEAGEWKITNTRMLHAVRDEEIQIPLVDR